MKHLFSDLLDAMRTPGAQEHVAVLRRFLLTLVAILLCYSVLFHLLMLYEGQQHTWLTGLYWTLTVMSTLGFGDITFTSDLGRAFSIFVLLTGVIFILILLPFTFIQHFYSPWMERQKREMVPRKIKEETTGHVLIAGTDAIALSLASDLAKYSVQAYILCTDTQDALKLLNQGYDVVTGNHDDMATYRALHAETAALLVVLDSDIRGTNIVFSAHEVAPQLQIVAGVERQEARDILRMAGCSRCYHFYSHLGEALARRVIKPSNRVSILGKFGRIVIAEAPVMRTPLAGKTLLQSALRKETGVNVIGVWERGVFHLPKPDTTFGQSTVVMVAGTSEQMASFSKLLSSTEKGADQEHPAIILGGGRVGLAVARSLARRNIPCVIVDRKKSIHIDNAEMIYGEAADLAVLEKAGIRDTPSIVVTTHDDDANIYLTIYCRRLRPDVQIISRASLDRNVNGLHMAGADLVLSLSSLVSSTVIKLLSPDRVLMLNERLSVFRYTIHGTLAGKTLMESGIRNRTGCSVLAVHGPDGSVNVNPEAGYEIHTGDKLYLIGDTSAQENFRKLYGIDADFSKDDGQWTSANSQSQTEAFTTFR